MGSDLLFLLEINFAYYLGGLKPDDEDAGENGEKQEINKRFKNAARRLFAREGLDFDRSPAGPLLPSFVRMIDELPGQWFNWLNSNLEEECRVAPVGTGSNTPLEFFCLPQMTDLLRPPKRPMTRLSRNSRVFTQIKLPLRADDLLREECKHCFWAFRKYLHPGMKLGWWQHEVANELQGFYRRLVSGERPKVVLMAPPQHGKTEQVKDFIAWIAGSRPELKTIFASYSDELAVAANRRLRRIMTSERYVTIFGHWLGDSGSRWLRNSNALEYVNHRGSFRNTTVEGQITGQGLDLGIVDDPIKGRIESSSKAVRDKCWA